MRQGEAGTNSGETARTDGNCDKVKRRRSNRSFHQDFMDHDGQQRSMALRGVRLPGSGDVLVSNYGSRTSRQRSINSQNPHLKQHTRFVEIETRRAREQAGGIAMPQIAQKIRSPAVVGEEQLVNHGVVETRHRAGVQAHSARR